MKKYVKNPVVIEAEQWTGLSAQFTELTEKGIISHIDKDTGSAFIKTLEGTMECKINDYIIKGIKGECYPCKPDIFELTYTEYCEPEN